MSARLEAHALKLWLDVNGERRQACDAGTMIHSVPSLIVFVSSLMKLEPGAPSPPERRPRVLPTL